MIYRNWTLDPVSKLDKITIRCYPPGEKMDADYLRLDYSYRDVLNFQGALAQAQQQIDVIEAIIETRK